MSAEAIATALGGRKAGAAWMACCPAHQDRDPSLAITDSRDGKVLVRCHAGCDQRDVIAALRARGAWDADARRPTRFSRKPDRPLPAEPDSDAIKRTEAALAIWSDAQSAEGTPVETYLRSRGLMIPIPPSIHFHAGLRHPSGDVWPAMVALVTYGVDGKSLSRAREREAAATRSAFGLGLLARLAFESRRQIVCASIGHVVVRHFCSRRGREASFFDEALLIVVGVGLLQSRPVFGHVGLCLEALDALRRVERDDLGVHLVVGHLLGRAAAYPAAPVEANYQRCDHADANCYRVSLQALAFKI
jgi:hypothetical protein